jgi:DNA-binding CsgD family transcriptional regulator
MDRFNEYWARNSDWAVDVYAPRGAPLVRDGRRVLVQSQVFSDDEIRHSAFHQEISLPSGCLHWAASCFTVDETAWCLPLFRGNEPFTRNEARTIAEVSHHLARIVTLAQRTTLARAGSEVAAFDKMGCAAMLVDWHGRIILINRAAEALSCRDFHVQNRKLWATDPRARTRLDRLLSGIRYGSRGVEMSVAPVIVGRNGRPWLLIESSPVTGVASDTFGGGRAILVITDVTSPRVSNASLLKLTFGLTAAEARLAAAICDGTELYAAARRFGVSRETVRSQLRSIFGKTGVRRQAELVARLHGLRPLTSH